MRSYFKLMAVSVVAILAAVPLRAETLSDALVNAYRNSGLLEAEQATLRATDEGVAAAVAAMRPAVQFVANWGKTRAREETRDGFVGYGNATSLTATIQASMTLFDFGRNAISLEIAKEMVLAARKDLVGVEQNVLLAAVDAYVNVQLDLQIVNLRRSNVNLITQELAAANDRFEVGEITRTDVSLAEAALAGARANLAAAEGQLAMSREAYKAATGNYPGSLAALPKAPAIPKSLDEARRIAVRSHPQILAMQHNVAAATLGVEAAKAQSRPKIDLSTSIGANNSYNGNDRLTGSVGIGLNQPIYTGGALASAQRKAIANKEAAVAGLRQTVIGVEQSVGNLWASLSIANASIAATNQQIEAAQAAFNGVREEANLGARTTLDVLDAEQDLLDARAARLEAEASRYVANYQVLAAMGLLTAQHLKLGIPTYDPEAYYNSVKNAPSTTVRGKKLDQILDKYAK